MAMGQSTDPSAPLRAILVDDEALARDCIRIALAQRSDITIVRECDEGDAAVAAIRELNPDLVFLDIQMPGMSGFEVVEHIGAESMPPVVFVTAHDMHALRAFQVHALDYVLKPIDDARLSEAVAHAHKQVTLRRQGELGRRFSALLAEIGHPLEAPQQHTAPKEPPLTLTSRLSIRVDGSLHLIAVGTIDWIEAAGNYVRVHAGKRHFLMRSSLAALGARLPSDQFIRIHRSTIVNVERIREVQAWFGGDYVALLHDGEKLRVSRSYADDLLGPVG